MLEKDVERKLVKMIESHGGLCLKWVCPGHSGVPDRICLLPGGGVVFVELKRPQKVRVSKLQDLWADRLSRLGFRRWMVWDEKVIKILERVITGDL